jgi:hypothetical protein
VRLPGAESCINAPALAQIVEAQLGYAVFVSASRAEISVEGRIEPTSDPAGFRAVIAVAKAAGEAVGTREIARATGRCDEMSQDIAFVIGMLVDPEAALNPHRADVVEVAPAPQARSAAPAPEARRAAPPPPPAPQVLPRAPAPAPPPPSREPWSLGLELGPAFSVGLLPMLGVGAAVRGWIQPPRRFSLHLGAVVWSPSSASPSDAGAELFGAEAFLTACPLQDAGDLVFYAACAGLQVGALRAVGFGYPVTLSQEQLLLNAVVEGRVRRRFLGTFTISGGIGVAVPFLRGRFFATVGGAERDVFVVSPVIGSADLSLGVELP